MRNKNKYLLQEAQKTVIIILINDLIEALGTERVYKWIMKYQKKI